MLHEIHDHINQEIRINTRTDTIFVITAILFNFIMLGVSSGLASAAADELGQTRAGTTSAIVLAINITISILVNGVAITGLLTGRATRKTLSQGLLRIYEDEEVSKYYHPVTVQRYPKVWYDAADGRGTGETRERDSAVARGERPTGWGSRAAKCGVGRSPEAD